MLHHVDAVGSNAVDDGIAVGQGIGRLIPLVVAVEGRGRIQVCLDHGNAHGRDKQVIVSAVYHVGEIGVFILGHDHLLQGMRLVVVNQIAAVAAIAVGFVRGGVLGGHCLISVDQPHGHAGGHFADLFHLAAHQQQSGDTADVIKVAGHIVVDEGSTALDADEVAVGQSAKVAGIGIVAGAVVVADAVADVAHGRLQLEVGVLVRLAKAGLGINRGYQYHAAGGLVGHVGQAQILEVVQGVVLAGKLLVGVDQQVGVHTVGRAHAVIDAG